MNHNIRHTWRIGRALAKILQGKKTPMMNRERGKKYQSRKKIKSENQEK
jgi:hypothetical protein